MIGSIRKLLGRAAMSQHPSLSPEADTDRLIVHARETARSTSDATAADTIEALCNCIENLVNLQADLRKTAFRDAVRGIGEAIRSNQVPDSVPWSRDLPGAYDSDEALATEIERLGASQPVDIGELRQLRNKLKTAVEGTDEIDEMAKRVYYATLFAREPSTNMLLPPGSPSRSIDLAALIVERVLPNGWWTMGCSGQNLNDLPVAKVGTWTGDNPKAETSKTTPLALLSAMSLTLIEFAKKEAG
jgi:hypothetical protein